jgi:hypothetical protein
LARFAALARTAQAAKVIRLGGFDSTPVMQVGELARNIECAKPCRQNQTPRGLRQPPMRSGFIILRARGRCN